jgi:hypothetical protein
LITVTLDEFYKVVLTKKPKEFLDILAGQISGLLSCQSDRDYPQIKFPRPLSTLSQLQGHETLGVLLLLVVSLHSKACWAKDSPDSNSFGRSKFVNPKDIESYRHLFEVLLVYKTWFWLDAVEKSTIVSGTQLSNATKYAMTRYVDTINRTQGHGLKMTKTHAPLHTDYNIHNFGSNNNSHSGPCKSNHIKNVKKPSRNTQRQKDTIDDQLCKQLSEKMVLDIVTGLVNDANARQHLNPESNNFSSSATQFAIDVANMASEGVGQGKTLTLSLHWLSSHKKDHPLVKPELTAQRFLLNLLLDAVDGNTCQINMVTFSCFTEHRRGDQIYRAHPDYRKGGPWYDWAYVEFSPDDTGEESHLYPAQIWFFVNLLKPIEISDEYREGVEDI